MTEGKFWTIIENGWLEAGGKQKVRERLAKGKLSEEQAEELMDESLDAAISGIRGELNDLCAEDLMAFDRMLEQKLYDIDRAEIQDHTDGSDDGFLYARGFIVIAGKGYYDAVNAKPSIAMADLWCEEMCYLSWHLYEEKFGKMPPSGISRETCSNKKGWPDLA